MGTKHGARFPRSRDGPPIQEGWREVFLDPVHEGCLAGRGKNGRKKLEVYPCLPRSCRPVLSNHWSRDTSFSRSKEDPGDEKVSLQSQERESVRG